VLAAAIACRRLISRYRLHAFGCQRTHLKHVIAGGDIKADALEDPSRGRLQ